MSNHTSKPRTADRKSLNSLELWRSFADSVPDMVLLVARDGTIEYVNSPPAGVTRNAIVGTSIFDFAAPEARAELMEALAGIFRDGATGVRTQHAIHPDGSEHWYVLHSGPLKVGDEVSAAIIVARDETETRRAKLALAESEARFRTLVEHAPEAIVVLDVDRQMFVDANDNACELFGLTMNQLMQNDPVALSPPNQPDGQPSSLAARAHIEAALAGKTPSFEWVHRTHSGRDVRCEIRLVRLPSGTQRLVRGSIIDVTEQRRLEEHMREGRKMDALGRMAAGIAHDFNNVLTVVNSSALMILESLDERSKVRSDVQAIVDAAQRGSAMVTQLLTFARQDDTPATRLDMNDVIRDVLRFAARVIDGRITLVQQLDPKGVQVCLDRTQLEQIIINLVLNARDAIQGALGAITITTRSRASTCTLRIADSGVGMTDEVRRRVFEPFFTTKASWGGTGLGLATVYSIVTRAGGSIVVDSAVGAGTAFEITLPNTSRE